MSEAIRRNKIKLALAGGLFLIAVVVFVVRSRGASMLPDEIKFVCVASGRSYDIDRREIRSPPLVNPDTGQRTLLPCVERDGSLFIDRHYASLLKQLAEVNQHVDPETLAVRAGP